MRDFGVLPHSGGYFDQDWKIMEILMTVRNAYLEELNRKK